MLGAFAAGIILRRLLPEGHEGLEVKLTGLAFGLLIPVFFITSGMAIDPARWPRSPRRWWPFVVLILVVRGGAVYVATRTTREDGRTGLRRAGERRDGAVRLDRPADHRGGDLGRRRRPVR